MSKIVGHTQIFCPNYLWFFKLNFRVLNSKINSKLNIENDKFFENHI